MTDNLLTEAGNSWKIKFTAPKELLPSFEEIIFAASYDNFPSISSFEIEEDIKNGILEAYYQEKPDLEIINKAIMDMSRILKITSPEVFLEEIENKNWVAESQKLLKPINAGRFFLYGSHDKDNIPNNKIAICIDAGQAFGTGSHGTTAGCLMAISDLNGIIDPAKMLDLGCGSGVLAIAMAKQWNGLILASDIDPIATDTAKENFLINNVPQIKGLTCDGLKDTILEKNGPYDLIVANILAGPLIEMASDIISNLGENSYLLLSGLLIEQQEAVLNAYESRNMKLLKTYPIKEWQTLLLQKS
ncbi:MAG: 50S ribosomal protein L11 methyltransferase [Emcibacteraceae bacterium]